MIHALIFDLDDTLYRERDFVESGYRAVARHIASCFGRDYGEIYNTMIETLNSEGRQMVMTVVHEQFTSGSVSIDELVSIYRNHQPTIRLYPGYRALLKQFSRSCRLGLITDGMPEVQERKVRTLLLEGLMDKIIYTWAHGVQKQKPHPYPFNLMLQSLHTEAAHALYIGDNPSKDCAGAHRAGMKCAQVGHTIAHRDVSQSDQDETPEYLIDSLFQLSTILQEMN